MGPSSDTGRGVRAASPGSGPSGHDGHRRHGVELCGDSPSLPSHPCPPGHSAGRAEHLQDLETLRMGTRTQGCQEAAPQTWHSWHLSRPAGPGGAGRAVSKPQTGRGARSCGCRAVLTPCPAPRARAGWGPTGGDATSAPSVCPGAVLGHSAALVQLPAQENRSPGGKAPSSPEAAWGRAWVMHTWPGGGRARGTWDAAGDLGEPRRG